MARLEAQQYPTGLYSSSSRKEPFADYLNNLGTFTVAAAGLVAALSTDWSRIPREPQNSQELFTRFASADMLTNVAIYAGPVAAVLLVNKAFYSIYQKMPQEKRAQIQTKVAELGSFFHRSSRI